MVYLQGMTENRLRKCFVHVRKSLKGYRSCRDGILTPENILILWSKSIDDPDYDQELRGALVLCNRCNQLRRLGV